ncbi:multiple sugar transport system substrate-binding protein [Devosia enhydra]|uniref:Multiple sugar transport system substrate-binding protein n=1 Tax=Devosia enhydra TaxID=665118 RepID=A0A1K2HZA6_9HYPH|nr:sugar ABC transporter substrate-binding protein [Devosia enhydra]SFZ85417.1 multiple sugar transport system substrate-binding protein [Devosia enhydra]
MTKALGAALGVAASIIGMALATTAIAQETTIRMWTFLNPAGTAPREVALAKIITQYEAANPGTKILVEPQVWDQMTPKFLAAHATGNAPDVIWVVTDFLGDAIASGSLADLNELFINDWPAERVADNAGAYWDLTSVDGKQHAIFVSRNYISLMYRKDLLDAAGIDPNGFATWQEFRDAAEQLTEKDAAGNVTRYGFAQGFSEQQADPSVMIPQLLATGEPLFNADGTANFASDAGVAAMTFLTDLVKDGISPRESVSWTVDDLFEQFAAGRLAMVQGPAVRVSTLQAQLGKDKVGLALWPGNGTVEHSPAVMAGWAVGVWSGSANAEAAGSFVEYMLGPDGDPIWVEAGGQVPGLLSTLANMKDFIAQPGNEYLSVAAEGAARYGWLTPIEFSVGGYRQALNKAAQRILVEGTDVATALEDAEAEFNRLNNR